MQAIRDLLAACIGATANGAAAELRHLMADDVIFLTPGQAPLRGAAAFSASFEQARIEPSGAMQELQISGEWAYCWTHLEVTVASRLHGTAQRRYADHSPQAIPGSRGQV